jgi:tripartite-type tricarboxylate transporter receptor subunit TctC
MQVFRSSISLRPLRFMATCAVAAGAIGPFGIAPAQAAGYPNRPVTIVVPYAPGGATDASARLVAQALQKQTGGNFIIENVAGAGTTIGSARVARAPADGYTLLWGGLSSNVMAPNLYLKLPFDAATAFEPISMIASQPYLLAVNAKSPLHTIQQLIAKAKAEPGKLNFGSPGQGSSPHLTTELILKETGITGQHVPYKGAAPALTALLGNDIDFLVDTPTAPLPMIKAGQLKALVVTSAKRIPDLPDVPTMQEAGARGFEASTWFALFAPRGTPPDVVATLNKAVNTVLNNPEVRTRMAQSYFTPAPSTPEQLAQTVKSETAKWVGIIKEKNIHID